MSLIDNPNQTHGVQSQNAQKEARKLNKQQKKQNPEPENLLNDRTSPYLTYSMALSAMSFLRLSWVRTGAYWI